MLYLFLTLLLLSHSFSGSGVSFSPRRGWKCLFILATEEDVEIFVDGCFTGLKAPSRIWVSPNISTLDISLRSHGCWTFQQRVSLWAEKVFIYANLSKKPLKLIRWN